MKITSSTGFSPRVRTQNKKQQLSKTNKIAFEGAPQKAGFLKVLALALFASIPASLGHLSPKAEKVALSSNNHVSTFVKSSADAIKAKAFNANEAVANIKPVKTKAKKASKLQPKTGPMPPEKADSLIANNVKATEEVKSVKNDSVANNNIVKDSTSLSEEDNNFQIFFNKPSMQKSLEKFEDILISYYDKEHKVIGSNRKSRVYFDNDLALVTSYRLLETAKENLKNTGKIINPKQLSKRKTDLYNTIADYVSDDKIECNEFNTKMLINKLFETKKLTKKEIPFVKVAFNEIKMGKS